MRRRKRRRRRSSRTASTLNKGKRMPARSGVFPWFEGCRDGEWKAGTSTLLRAVLACGLFAASASMAQNCCTHQGQSVQCPAGLPSGSGSVEFVQGGTVWITPGGGKVIVPQTSFVACGAGAPPAATPPTKPPPTPPSTSMPPSTTPAQSSVPPPSAPTSPSTNSQSTATPTPRPATNSADEAITPRVTVQLPLDSGPRPIPPARPLNEPDPTVVPVPAKPADENALGTRSSECSS